MPGAPYVLRWEEDSEGSVMELDLSADGTRLVSCAKTKHISNPVALKRYELFQFERDFFVEGQPYAGAQMRAGINGEPGKYGYLVMATAGAPSPLQLPIGLLHVSRSQIYDVIPMGRLGADGRAELDFDVPNDGTEQFYLQAFTGSPRRLSRDWELVTLL